MIVSVHQYGTGRESGIEVDMPVAYLMRVRDGLLTGWRLCADVDEASRWRAPPGPSRACAGRRRTAGVDGSSGSALAGDDLPGAPQLVLQGALRVLHPVALHHRGAGEGSGSPSTSAAGSVSTAASSRSSAI